MSGQIVSAFSRNRENDVSICIYAISGQKSAYTCPSGNCDRTSRQSVILVLLLRDSLLLYGHIDDLVINSGILFDFLVNPFLVREHFLVAEEARLLA